MLAWVILPILLSLVGAQLSEDDKKRIDCYPEPGASQEKCEARGCIWKSVQTDDKYLPFCFFASSSGYVVSSGSNGVYNLQRNGGPPSPWGQDLSQIQLTVKKLGSVLNVKLGVQGRYEPPVDMPREAIASTDSLTFSIDNSTNPFSFQILRDSNYRKLFDTSFGPLIFADRFIQIASYLPSDHMYGWGENIHQQINHDLSRYLVWGMFARDEPPNSGGLDTKNLYGVHPYYMILEPDGNAHGVLILNSNAQDVTTLPAPGFVYRTIGGNLDMYFFPGPTPEAVQQQYLSFIGKPMLPAYWSLGYQLCRYGYKNLAEAQEVISNVRSLGIPFDVAMFDIDYMQRYKDFTIGSDWSDLPSYTQQLRSWGMHLILIWDPAIQVDYDTYQRGVAQNARFIEWDKSSQVQNAINDLYPLTKGSKTMLGVVWPDRHVAFPDFLDPTGTTTTWWSAEFKRFYQQVQFEGSWIDMNEPSVFGTNDNHPWYYDNPDHPDDPPLFCPTQGDDAYYENAPYLTHAVYNFQGSSYLFTKTLCMLAMTANRTQRFYDTKSLYGLSESVATRAALQAATGQRGTIISRSTFPSSGRWAGHWLGDNTARWEDLRTSVIGAQEFNLFGIPYVGSDVCGFIGDTTEELCLRWQQMGSFHSFYRNHNNNVAKPQDPARWPTVAAATKKSNLFRYRHLPYLFSLHLASSLRGDAVIRPVFFSFPTDEITPTLSYQFMWGPAVLVAPVVTQGATSVRAYLPSGTWYSLYDYKENQQISVGWSDFPAPTTYNTPTFVRGGYILPRQDPDVTTDLSRKNPFGVLVTLDAHKTPTGELFWDDGVAIVNDINKHNFYHFNLSFHQGPNTSVFAIGVDRKATGLTLPTLDEIIVLGYPSAADFTSFTLNGQKVNINVQTSSYNAFKKVLTIRTANLIDLTKADSIVLSWKCASQLNDKMKYHIADELL